MREFFFLFVSYSIVLLFAHLVGLASAGYQNNDEARYLQDFPTLIAASYSTPLPESVTSNCVNNEKLPFPLPIVNFTSDVDATEFQTMCGTTNLCSISAGVTLRLTGNVNVAAILNSVCYIEVCVT